jgi:4-hydroxy-tetrahydrodipicolinate synthase
MPELDLAGIIPAIVTPMTPEAELDLAAVPRYVDWLANQGPVALAVNVDTGEGPHLSTDERRAMLEAVRGALQGRSGIVAGVGGPSTRDAVANARQAEAAGADALLVFPVPAFLSQPLRPDVVYRHHAEIAAAVGLPLVLFQLQPALGGAIYPANVLDQLLEIPTVVAIKEASFDPIRYLELRARLQAGSRRILLLSGNDNFIAESLLLGADGALLGFATLGTAEHVALLEAARRGDVELARKIGAPLQRLADVIFAPPVVDYRVRVKEALRALGVIPSAAVRPPLLPVDDGEREVIRRAVEAAGLPPADATRDATPDAAASGTPAGAIRAAGAATRVVR